MTTNLPDDPRVTFALFKLQDVLEAQKDDPDPDFAHIVAHRDEVIQRYQYIFRAENLPNLSKADFIGFLKFKNNHHWTQLSRVQKFMTEDMTCCARRLSRCWMKASLSMNVSTKFAQSAPGLLILWFPT